jgi:hypothetical protein
VLDRAIMRPDDQSDLGPIPNARPTRYEEGHSKWLKLQRYLHLLLYGWSRVLPRGPRENLPHG